MLLPALARSFALATLLAVTTLLPALGTRKPLAQFGRQTWGSDSGLPQNTVHSVLQTRDGFLWVATEAGLVRFDGLNFRVYDTENTPQLHSDIINDLEEDSSGALWISTSAGLVRERAGQFTLFTTAEGLPSDAALATFPLRRGGLLALTSTGVALLHGDRFETAPGAENLQPVDGSSNVAEDELGEIWIAGSHSLVALSPGRWKAIPVPVSAELGELRAVAALRAGEVWAGGRHGIEIIGEHGRTRLTMRDGLPSEEISALLPDGSGGMWIGTSRGLARWSGGYVSAMGEGDARLSGPVQRIYRDREGTLWLATGKDVARVSGGRIDLLPRSSRLTGVLSIFEDREGSVWFGTDNAGLTVLREQALSTVSEQDGLSAGVVRAVFQDSEGTIWIGTNGGGLDRIDQGKISVLVSHPALSSDVVLSVAKIGPDLWVGTPNGLNRVRDERVRVFTTEDGLPDDFVRSLYADRDGSLWIGTRNGLSHLVGGSFTSFSRMDGLGSDLIGTILRSRNGDLWIGTLGGLSRLQDDRFVNFTRRDGLGSDAVTSLLEDSAGALWIGTQDGGLSRLRDGRIVALSPARTGLPETIFGILQGSAGDLWMSSRRGIYRVSASELNAFADKGAGAVSVRTYGVADGMRISEGSSGGHPAAWRMRDGSLWFATLDGAVFATPESSATNHLPPTTVIEEVRLNDRSVDVESLHSQAPLTLLPGERRMTVAYAGLSFVAPQKVRYRYKLESFDKSWVEAAGRREAFYTNLPPGRYRFLVLSSNNDGVWSTEPSGFNLRVQPTLLQTRWFYGLLALGLAALAFAVYRWRVRSVEAQYNAVLQERGRIAREIHDTLAQGYVAISVQLELSARLLQTSKEAALKQMEETRELVRGSLAEARSSIWNLRSQNDAETLPSRLAAITEVRTGAEGPAIKLEIKGTYRPLSRGVEKEIQRVAQEAVTNAIRHARARHIYVVLRYDSSTLRLQIKDDGSGFTNAVEDLSRTGHFGLQGMRERAARIGATIEVASRPGIGTTVDLQIDSRKAERSERSEREDGL